MSTQYAQQCLALDKELAELLGWHRFYWSEIHSVLKRDNPSLQLVRREVPRWTQDDAAAFRLAVEYDVFPEMPIGLIFVKKDKYSLLREDEEQEYLFSVFQNNPAPDKICKVRFAIVQAVVNKLKEAK